MTDNIKIRRYLRSIPVKADFEALLQLLKIDEIDTAIMRRHYLDGKSFDFIADELGFAPVSVYKRHRRVLLLIDKLHLADVSIQY